MKRKCERRPFRAAIIFCSLLFLQVFATVGIADAVGPGMSAPDFRLETLDGDPVGLADFKGKQPLLLVFWASWCPSCREEVPRINRIAAEYGPKGLAVLAVNVGVNDSPATAAGFRERHRMAYPVAFDQGSKISRAFGVMGVPTILLLDRQGIVRYHGATVPTDMAARWQAVNNNRQ